MRYRRWARHQYRRSGIDEPNSETVVTDRQIINIEDDFHVKGIPLKLINRIWYRVYRRVSTQVILICFQIQMLRRISRPETTSRKADTMHVASFADDIWRRISSQSHSDTRKIDSLPVAWIEGDAVKCLRKVYSMCSYVSVLSTLDFSVLMFLLAGRPHQQRQGNKDVRKHHLDAWEEWKIPSD